MFSCPGESRSGRFKCFLQFGFAVGMRNEPVVMGMHENSQPSHFRCPDLIMIQVRIILEAQKTV
jgi:hypothetical protein